MKKNMRWIVIVGGLAVLCVAAMLLLFVLREPGNLVSISQDGQLLYELPLNEDTELTIPASNGGYNTVVIRDGQVSVTEASCPDQVCVKHIPISQTGVAPIACLPNRLTVLVVNDKDAQKDEGT